MIFGDKEIKLVGRHFLARISLPENFDSGLLNVQRDPRKQKRRPAAYAGEVEEVGSGCFLVKPGDKIVFRRWDWGQFDADDERIVAEEDDLLIMNDEIPAPGVIVMNLLDQTLKTDLALPQNLRLPKLPSLKGEVIAFSPYRMGELKGLVEKGKMLIFQRSDTNQWSYGDGRIAIKVCSYFEILAIEERVAELATV